jgi:hypothetical protein
MKEEVNKVAPLIIKIGEEYKIKKHKASEFKNSIFKEVFHNAARNANEIIKQAIENKKKYNENQFYNITNDDYNNIIVFSGDRGTGKSSTMVSFAEALLYKDNIEKKEDVGDFFEELDYKILKETSFLSIDMIDPSLFESKDTLLEIVISKMFLKFQKSLDNKDSDFNYDKKRELVTSFQCVFENLKTLHNDKKVVYELDVIEALSKLANGSNLKENFYKLVDEFLNFYEIKNGVLLIIIDDFDLNIKGAFTMLEDIRKFLIQKNILILLSGKIEQLNDSVKQEIIKDYSKLFEFEKKTQSVNDQTFESPQSKASKFIEKLLPPDHHISISSILIESDINLCVEKNNKLIIESKSIQDGLFDFIFQKGIFLHKPNNGFSYFLPRTLRDLTDLFMFIDGMKKNDLPRFKNYLNTIKNEYIEGIDIFVYSELEYNKFALNKFFANWLNNDQLPRRSAIPFSLLRPSNFRNSSFADILSLFIILSRQASSIDFKLKKNIIFKSSLYSLTVKQLTDKDKNLLWQVFAGEIVNDIIELFPKDGKKRRDYFHVKNVDKFLTKRNIDELLWVNCFISHVGKIEQINYRNNEQVYYENVLIENNITWVTFNCMSFIISLFFPKKIIKRISNDKFNAVESSEFVKELIDWEQKMWTDFSLFYNIDFVIDLINELSHFSRRKIKKSLGSFSNTLKIYFIEGMEYSLISLNEKYPYINLDVSEFMNNPIFNYWEKNSKSIDILLDEIYNNQSYESDYTEDDSKLAKYILNRYSRYFGPDGDFSSRGAKQAMNSVVKLFVESESIKEQLQEYRDLMDQDPEDGLERIKELLNVIVKNG